MSRMFRRGFWKKHPMYHFQFIFRGNDSTKIREFKTTANIESQAEVDARDYLDRFHNESHTLLAVWKEPA